MRTQKMLLTTLTVAAIILGPVSCTRPESQPTWVIGYWHMVADEDGGPTGSVMEFRANGDYIGYDKYCNPYPTAQYHQHRGNIYVTNEIPGKGPVSVIFRPSGDRNTLTFTSARTHNNATYKRLPGKECRTRQP